MFGLLFEVLESYGTRKEMRKLAWRDSRFFIAIYGRMSRDPHKSNGVTLVM